MIRTVLCTDVTVLDFTAEICCIVPCRIPPNDKDTLPGVWNELLDYISSSSPYLPSLSFLHGSAAALGIAMLTPSGSLRAPHRTT